MTTAGKNTYDRKKTYVQHKLHMYVTERSYLKQHLQNAGNLIIQ